MKSILFSFRCTLLMLLVLFIGEYSTAQESFYYTSPVNNAIMVRPETSIILKTEASVDLPLFKSMVSISGSKSESVNFEIKYLKDENVILIDPEAHLKFDEHITLSLKNKTILRFQTMKQDVALPLTSDEYININQQKNAPATVTTNLTDRFDLPDGFPEYEITEKNNPSPGYYFMTPLKWEASALYVIIMDNYGFPVFFQKQSGGCYDFKLQSSGELTFYESNLQKYVRLNAKFENTGYYSMGNGYSTDLHDCNVQPNGHVWMLGYDPQLVDMDTVVEGGQPGAVVTGLIVQEQDADGNVIFQWRSWDHFNITDAVGWVILTAPSIDYVHGNTIEIVDDNSILISCRNMYEITKISRNTGDIIWRLGGLACENNMFDFTNDTIRFKMQHDVRYHGQNLISLFNNSSNSGPDPWSSSIFYELDENNMTATQIKRYYNDPPVLGDIMGNCQLLENGNIVTGWGRPDNDIIMTEFSPQGNSEMQIKIPHTVYRCFKFNWQSEVFTQSSSSLDFGNIFYQDSATMSFFISNNLERTIELNGFHMHTETFKLMHEGQTPIQLQPGEEKTFQIKFLPESIGSFEDVLSIYEDIQNDTITQRITCQVYLKGTASEDQGIYHVKSNIFSITPNPGKSVFILKLINQNLPANISISNSSGEIITSYQVNKAEAFPINLSKFPDGMYFVRVVQPKAKTYQIQKIIKASN